MKDRIYDTIASVLRRWSRSTHTVPDYRCQHPACRFRRATKFGETPK